MRVCLLVSVVSAILLDAAAADQRPAHDALPASTGEVVIVPIVHATLQIVHGPHVILVDPTTYAGYDGPYSGGVAPRINYDGLKPPTLVIVTDIHGDHFDSQAIESMKTPTTKVVVPAVPGWQWSIAGAITMTNGQTRTVDGVTVEAMPMYNLQRGPQPGQVFHTKGRGNGYVLTIGGKRLYVAGDTECTPEMKALKNIDVAFLPMNLPYTMTPSEAAECAKVFKPKVVYPYHYRGQDLTAFETALKGSTIEVRLRDWYSVSGGAK